MAGAYSQDLRNRVIGAVIGGKMSRRGAAARACAGNPTSRFRSFATVSFGRARGQGGQLNE